MVQKCCIRLTTAGCGALFKHWWLVQTTTCRIFHLVYHCLISCIRSSLPIPWVGLNLRISVRPAGRRKARPTRTVAPERSLSLQHIPTKVFPADRLPAAMRPPWAVLATVLLFSLTGFPGGVGAFQLPHVRAALGRAGELRISASAVVGGRNSNNQESLPRQQFGRKHRRCVVFIIATRGLGWTETGGRYRWAVSGSGGDGGQDNVSCLLPISVERLHDVQSSSTVKS